MDSELNEKERKADYDESMAYDRARDEGLVGNKWHKAKKKPVVIEWREVNGEHEEIATLENRGGQKLIGNKGVDVIIRGVKGELYPCKKSVFALTYEVVADNTPVG